MIGRETKLFLATGMMGGLSTFSSFVWGPDQLLAIPVERLSAILYLVLNMVLGSIPVRLGLRFGGRLEAIRPVHTARRS